ncbi:MAG: KaiC 1 [Flavobacteriaceae bacterium CG18_big_fil_WC_8_21_14_2_50_34_36]|nr:MAG: KaiC 1 [Flavobacteriaceae bacterium CG18_big_fil_WC_8_21_14_2_50_34_36]PJC08485.1 MAG: KaiC 1 [Flavobacteriaceae bacterium CG_4_9_14_0_8_um_filter_34_30]
MSKYFKKSSMKSTQQNIKIKVLPKSPTGITGLDEITQGGLPKGRPTLVCGNAGCGKTLLGLEFLVRGAIQYNEPGVFMCFEETAKELTENVVSLGYDLNKLVAQKKLVLDHVKVDRSEIEETGEYDLEGLFIRLNYAIDSIGAKRVVLDTLESLFSGLSNDGILRAELRRLFHWLKEKGVTAIITGERGDGILTRKGLEEYVSDCVILLDNRVTEQSSTRRLRIVKYRGATHGTNEYPFLIEDSGFVVMPITSAGLDHKVSSQRVSTGIPRLDTMMGGKGYYRGSSVMVSGTAGTGKSSLSAHLADAACKRGERVIYFALEESSFQIIRNMRSIGIDLGKWEEKELIKFHSRRPTNMSVESYLTTIYKDVDFFKPKVVIIDPISSFIVGANNFDAKSMMIRLIDFLKSKHITAFLTCLTSGGANLEHTQINISSLIDTWLLVRDIEIGGERNRGLLILKSRGMAHSNQVREYRLTDHGAELLDVYIGPGGVLTGSARIAHEEKEIADKQLHQEEIEQKQTELEFKRKIMDAQIEALRLQFASEQTAVLTNIKIVEKRFKQILQNKAEMGKRRNADLNDELVS